MNKLFILLIPFCLSLAINNCTILRIESPEFKSPLFLANSNAKCDPKMTKEFRQWYIIYGSIPLYTTSPSELFSNSKNTSIKLSQKSDWIDILFTGVLGITTSISTNRLVVETCNADKYVFADNNQKDIWLKQQEEERLEQAELKNKTAIQDKLIQLMNMPLSERWLLIIQKDGENTVGQLEKLENESITLSIQDKNIKIEILNIQAAQSIKAPF